MSARTLARLAILLGVLVLLWGGAALGRRHSETAPAAADRFRLPAPAIGTVGTVRIVKPADAVVLARRDSTWTVNGHAASRTAVGELFTALADTTACCSSSPNVRAGGLRGTRRARLCPRVPGLPGAATHLSASPRGAESVGAAPPGARALPAAPLVRGRRQHAGRPDRAVGRVDRQAQPARPFRAGGGHRAQGHPGPAARPVPRVRAQVHGVRPCLGRWHAGAAASAGAAGRLGSPAHTVGTVQYVDPRLRIGVQSSIGLDTVVGGCPPA